MLVNRLNLLRKEYFGRLAGAFDLVPVHARRQSWECGFGIEPGIIGDNLVFSLHGQGEPLVSFDGIKAPSIALGIHSTEAILGDWMPQQGGLSVPGKGLGITVRNTLPFEIKVAQCQLGISMPTQIRHKAVPFRGAEIILADGFATGVHGADEILGPTWPVLAAIEYHLNAAFGSASIWSAL